MKVFLSLSLFIKDILIQVVVAYPSWQNKHLGGVLQPVDMNQQHTVDSKTQDQRTNATSNIRELSMQNPKPATVSNMAP